MVTVYRSIVTVAAQVAGVSDAVDCQNGPGGQIETRRFVSWASSCGGVFIYRW